MNVPKPQLISFLHRLPELGLVAPDAAPFLARFSWPSAPRSGSTVARILAVPVWVVLATSCTQVGTTGEPLALLPEVLEPLERAENTSAQVDGEIASVSYEIPTPYPADVELAEISRRVSPEWKPRTEDFWNPGLPTSQIRGWTDYIDGTTTPNTRVHAWNNQWQNSVGDLMVYQLLYRSKTPPPGIDSMNPTVDRLFVRAYLLSSSEAHRILATKPDDSEVEKLLEQARAD